MVERPQDPLDSQKRWTLRELRAITAPYHSCLKALERALLLHNPASFVVLFAFYVYMFHFYVNRDLRFFSLFGEFLLLFYGVCISLPKIEDLLRRRHTIPEPPEALLAILTEVVVYFRNWSAHIHVLSTENRIEYVGIVTLILASITLILQVVQFHWFIFIFGLVVMFYPLYRMNLSRIQKLLGITIL